jgi:hypothetical protein
LRLEAAALVYARELNGAALPSLAAGYCAVAKLDGKQPAKANAEP